MDVLELVDAGVNLESAVFVAFERAPFGSWRCPGCGDDLSGLDEDPMLAIRAYLKVVDDEHPTVKLAARRCAL